MIRKGSFLLHYLKETIPLVKMELERLQNILIKCQDRELASFAKRSIEEKAFHCIGGASLTQLGKQKRLPLLYFIVSFQSISDYLDTLCDEGGNYCEKTARQLHKAMMRALWPGKSHADYYRFYPKKEDGGYLEALVEGCQKSLKLIPNYGMVQDKVLEILQFYIDLQSLKHLTPGVRERKLVEWYEKKCPIKGIYWYEFAAACGSTLSIFSLITLASKKELTTEEIELMYLVYFPWISGLHILLDYLIDAKDDQKKGELNFTSFYPNIQKLEERLFYFLKISLEKISLLSQKEEHETIVQGLLALYLSDDKSRLLPHPLIKNLLRRGGIGTYFMHQLSLILRRAGFF